MLAKAKSVTMKSLAGFMIVVMVVLSFSSSVFAATTKRTFKVRQSQSDSSAGPIVGRVVIDSKEKTITFVDDTSFYSPHVGRTLTFDAGTTFEYTIKTMKDGKEIKLDWVYDADPEKEGTWTIMHNYPKMKHLKGKIHISGSNSFANITKIDSFKIGGEKVGFYFRQN